MLPATRVATLVSERHIGLRAPCWAPVAMFDSRSPPCWTPGCYVGSWLPCWGPPGIEFFHRFSSQALTSRALAPFKCICDPKYPTSKCLPGPPLRTLKACPKRTGPPCRCYSVRSKSHYFPLCPLRARPSTRTGSCQVPCESCRYQNTDNHSRSP